MNKIELDEIDLGLLKTCLERSGQPLKKIVEPFLCSRRYQTLYARLLRMECLGYVRIDRSRQRGRALCYVTELGKEALSGGAE